MDISPYVTRFAGWTAAAIAGGTAVVLVVVLMAGAFDRADDGRRSETLPLASTTTPAIRLPVPTPLPRTWIDGLHTSRGGQAMFIPCLDANHDRRLNATDDPEIAPLDVPLSREDACARAHGSDWYSGTPSDVATYSCSAPKPPLLVIAIAGGGTDLLVPSKGESLGLLDFVNRVQASASQAGISSLPILTASAIVGSEPPQTQMERWLTHELKRRLDAMPCLRAVLIGHSHGAVTVTSVATVLDARYSDRLYGVLLDRTLALYDAVTHEFPERTPILNVYQLNEGWHGIPLDFPSLTNLDVSHAWAPLSPSEDEEATSALTIVSHPSLDDSKEVHELIIERVMAWLESDPTPGAAGDTR